MLRQSVFFRFSPRRTLQMSTVRDVYAVLTLGFALLLYQLVSGVEPYKAAVSVNDLVSTVVVSDERPVFPLSFPCTYYQAIV